MIDISLWGHGHFTALELFCLLVFQRVCLSTVRDVPATHKQQKKLQKIRLSTSKKKCTAVSHDLTEGKEHAGSHKRSVEWNEVPCRRVVLDLNRLEMHGLKNFCSQWPEMREASVTVSSPFPYSSFFGPLVFCSSGLDRLRVCTATDNPGPGWS